MMNVNWREKVRQETEACGLTMPPYRTVSLNRKLRLVLFLPHNKRIKQILSHLNFDGLVKSLRILFSVIPAKAGIKHLQ